MNAIEWIFDKAGRAVGSYQKGIETAFSTSGARPQLTDPTAWSDPYFWGAGLSGKKPRTKQDYINYFAGWTYICSKRNGQGVAINPLRLYVAKDVKGKKFKTIETRPVEKEKLKYLQQNQRLDPWLAKAEEIEEVVSHTFIDLMRSVNPYNNSFDLWELTVTFQELTGEAYWYLPSASVDGDKVPQQIWVIPSQFINPKFGTSLNNAITHYEYKRGNVEINLRTEDVIMFKYPNPNNTFTGFSIVRGIAAAVYIQREMNAFETSILENRARVGGIIEESKNISRPESERVKQRIKQEHAGPRNAGKDLYLPGGLKYTRSAMTPEELSFIEGRKQNRIEIMAAHDIPEAILINEGANRANTEGAAYQWAKYGILPRLKRIEEKLNEAMLPRYDDRLFVSFDDPVPEDKEQVLKESVELTNAGIKSVNEDRAQRGMEPIEGGEEPLIDSKRIPLSMAGVMPEQTPEQETAMIESVSEKAMKKIREVVG